MYQVVWELTGYSHNSNDQWEIGRVQVGPCKLYIQGLYVVYCAGYECHPSWV